MKSVTILSTVKNVQTTAEPWLSSILSQDYKDFYDVVVVDSLSVDGTMNILIDYSLKNKNLKLVELKSSQPEALNYAIKNKLLKGELVALIDGDCVAPKNWIQTMVSTMDRSGADAVGGPGLTPRDVNLLQRIIGFELDKRFLAIPEGPIKRHPNMNLIIKKSILEEIMFDEAFPIGYDAIFCHHLLSRGYKLWYNPNAFVLHHHRASLKGYIKQQFLNGKYAFKISKEIKTHLKGDNINSLYMISQPFILGLSISFLVISPYYREFLTLSELTFLILNFLLFIDIVGAYLRFRDVHVIFLYPLYLLRIVSWLIGALDACLRDLAIFLENIFKRMDGFR